jgi:hypothetical protein
MGQTSALLWNDSLGGEVPLGSQSPLFYELHTDKNITVKEFCEEWRSEFQEMVAVNLAWPVAGTKRENHIYPFVGGDVVS